jgi:hypothetical protein
MNLLTKESNLLIRFLNSDLWQSRDRNYYKDTRSVQEKCNFRKLNEIQFLLNPLQVSSYQFHFKTFGPRKGLGPILKRKRREKWKTGHTQRKIHTSEIFEEFSLDFFLRSSNRPL